MHQVGDTVYADFGRYGRIDVRKGKVVKVTPTGRINVDFGMKFFNGTPDIRQFKNGRKIGSATYHTIYLITQAKYESCLAHQREQEALRAYNDKFRSFPSAKDKAEALAQVEALAALAAAIPGDDE